MPLDLNISPPVIKRVRGYRFYSQDGIRYLDFYQENGKSILGSRPAGFSNALKKEIEKGNYYSVSSGYEKKIIRALKELSGTDSFNAAVFCTAGEAAEFISAKEDREVRVCPDFPETSSYDRKGMICQWYPFCGITLKDFLADHRYVMPLLPFPGSFSPVVLLSSDADLAGGTPVSPLLLAGLNIIIYRLIQHIEKEPYKDWKEFIEKIDKIWDVKTPYLLPRYTKDNQPFVYKTFLANQILIQPVFSGLSALPAEISDGERAIFLKTADKVIRGIY